MVVVNRLAVDPANQPEHVFGFVFRSGLKAALVAQTRIANALRNRRGWMEDAVAHADIRAEQQLELDARPVLFAQRPERLAHGPRSGEQHFYERHVLDRKSVV